MTLIALCMARNEDAVIGGVVEHLYNEGVDQVIVEDGHSTDRTRYCALDAGAEVIAEQDRAYDQSARMSRLASDYCSPGDWFIPFDADEYWYASTETEEAQAALELGQPWTIRDALLGTDATCCMAWMFLHRDWEHRSKNPKPLPKVAFRWQPGAVIAFGNHSVTGQMPGETRWGVLDLREWQYRSLEHFVAKVQKQRELVHHTPGLSGQFGSHKRAWLTMTDPQLEAEWVRMQSENEWVFDPIPALLSQPSTPPRSS